VSNQNTRKRKNARIVAGNAGSVGIGRYWGLGSRVLVAQLVFDSNAGTWSRCERVFYSNINYLNLREKARKNAVIACV
jgi:hypothetical protein